MHQNKFKNWNFVQVEIIPVMISRSHVYWLSVVKDDCIPIAYLYLKSCFCRQGSCKFIVSVADLNTNEWERNFLSIQIRIQDQNYSDIDSDLVMLSCNKKSYRITYETLEREKSPGPTVTKIVACLWA
jgi:hypothetical protein